LENKKDRFFNKMVWKEVGFLVDSYEKGKTIFYLDLILIIDILLLITSLLLRKKLLIIITAIIFIAIIIFMLILQKWKK